jgi:hypothetical protein
MVGNAARNSWHLWQWRQPGICNLQILLTDRGFESLSLCHNKSNHLRAASDNLSVGFLSRQFPQAIVNVAWGGG